MAVRFTDNSDLILRRVASNCQDAMKKTGEMLVEAVQNKILYGYSDLHGQPPHTEIVDTGRLFDSIQADVSRASQNAFGVTVGTDVPYAQYPHDGTRYLKGRPYMTDGVLEAREDAKRILSGEIPKGI